jgi:hypothetical protein
MKLVIFVEYRAADGLYQLVATFAWVRVPEVLALFGAAGHFDEAPLDATEGADLPRGTFTPGAPADMSRQIAHHYYPARASRDGVRCVGHMDVLAFERFLEHVAVPPPTLRAVLGALVSAFDEEKARAVWWIEKR